VDVEIRYGGGASTAPCGAAVLLIFYLVSAAGSLRSWFTTDLLLGMVTHIRSYLIWCVLLVRDLFGGTLSIPLSIVSFLI
jgi:hypothetical protein